MATRLNEKFIKGLMPPNKGYKVIYDDGPVKGFAIRVTKADTKSFILNFRHGGSEWRLTIGRWPVWSVEAARKEAARLWREKLDKGINPLRERQEERAAPTVNELCDRYLKEHVANKRPSTQRDYGHYLRRFIRPKIGRLKVAEVEFQDVEAMRRALHSTPVQANRLMAVTKSLFNFASSARCKMRPDSPVTGVERYAETARDRYLEPDELGRLLTVLRTYHDKQAANIVRVLLLTGARSGEVFRMTWDQINFKRGMWTKPASATKQAKIHKLPLSAPTLQLLSDLKKTSTGEYVFPGRVRGEPIKRIQVAWANITKAADLEGVRVHDLRHAHASLLASAGMSLEIIGALLGHTVPTTTARYADLFPDVQRKAAERVAAALDAAENGADGAEVVSLPR